MSEAPKRAKRPELTPEALYNLVLKDKGRSFLADLAAPLGIRKNDLFARVHEHSLMTGLPLPEMRLIRPADVRNRKSQEAYVDTVGVKPLSAHAWGVRVTKKRLVDAGLWGENRELKICVSPEHNAILLLPNSEGITTFDDAMAFLENPPGDGCSPDASSPWQSPEQRAV